MRHSISAVFAVILYFPPSVFAPDSVHTGYWRNTTLNPSTHRLTCQGVTTERSMIAVLNNAGWRGDTDIPDIDWSSDEAVIIARDQYLDFYGLFEQSDKVILSYGPRRQFANFGSGSFAGDFAAGGGGNVNPVMPPPAYPNQSVIIVSHSRDLDDNREFFCQRQPLP